MNDNDKNKIRGFFDTLRSQIDGDHQNKIFNEESKIIRWLKKVPILSKYISSISTMIDMIKSYVTGSYTEVPIHNNLCNCSSYGVFARSK